MVILMIERETTSGMEINVEKTRSAFETLFLDGGQEKRREEICVVEINKITCSLERECANLLDKYAR